VLVIAFIIVGLAMILGIGSGEAAGVSNYTANDGLFRRASQG